MALVNSNRNKKTLDRGPKIEPAKQVTRAEVEKALEPKETSTKNTTATTKKAKQQVEKITYSTNIRVDNHDRNTLDALKYMGVGPSHQAIIKALVQNYIDGMPKEYIEEFSMELDRNERKDARLKGKK